MKTEFQKSKLAMLSALGALTLFACSGGNYGNNIKPVAIAGFFANDELLPQGKTHFKAGNYGRAYSIYKEAVSVFPNDPEAWLGYAASNDMLSRFDKSDDAYRRLRELIGDRPEYLNNYGYSLLLRGNLKGARQLFIKAYEIDPSNEITANNLQLLRNSVYSPQRG